MPELTLEQYVRLELLKSFITKELIEDSCINSLRHQQQTIVRFVTMVNTVDLAAQYTLEGKSDKFRTDVNAKIDEIELEREADQKAEEDERAKKNIEKAITGVTTAIAAFTAATSKA